MPNIAIDRTQETGESMRKTFFSEVEADKFRLLARVIGSLRLRGVGVWSASLEWPMIVFPK